MAQGHLVVVDRDHAFERSLAFAKVAVLLVVADAHDHADEPANRLLFIEKRSQGGIRRVVLVFRHFVVNVIRTLKLAELQAFLRALQLNQHRFQSGIAMIVGRDLTLDGLTLHGNRQDGAQQTDQQQCFERAHYFASGFWWCAPGVSNPGGGSTGGRSWPCAIFCTSISENSIAGAAAETGTAPDSAPHSPLNTSIFSPVSTMRLSAASGVPMISTPRTSSSGRPSAYIFHTISGMIWNAWGMLRRVRVKPPAMSSK